MKTDILDTTGPCVSTNQDDSDDSDDSDTPTESIDDPTFPSSQLSGAPPRYGENPINSQNLSPSELEGNYFRKLTPAAVSFLEKLIGGYKNTRCMPKSNTPWEITISACADGMILERRKVSGMDEIKGRPSLIYKDFHWRPDGIWRDGVRATFDNQGILVETRIHDWALPENERLKPTHRFEIETVKGKDRVRLIENGKHIGSYIIYDGWPPYSLILLMIFMYLVIVIFFAYLIGTEDATTEWKARKA